MATTPWRPNMTLKECLPCKGMLWEDHPHILRSPEYDELVLLSFREKYIPIASGNISFEVTMLVFVANQKVGRHHKAADYAPGKEYDFFAKIARFNRTGRKLPQHVYAELFRALIAARVRFLEHNPASTETASEMAVQLDELIANMDGCYSEAEMSRRLEEEILKAGVQQGSSTGGELGGAESAALGMDLS